MSLNLNLFESKLRLNDLALKFYGNVDLYNIAVPKPTYNNNLPPTMAAHVPSMFHRHLHINNNTNTQFIEY